MMSEGENLELQGRPRRHGQARGSEKRGEDRAHRREAYPEADNINADNEN
jgi:hypothetical protein